MAIRLSLGKPHLGLRIRLRTLIAAIALFAVALWAALSIWSPTRRLSRLVRAGQPTYVRREAASALGHEIPFWEVDQAVHTLIEVCDDPSPRVREYAAVGLAQLGTKADPGILKLMVLLNDEDRFVRYSAAAALGRIVRPQTEQSSKVAEALAPLLEDPDPDVQLTAAEALCRMGRIDEAIGTLVSACASPEKTRRDRARMIMTQPGTDRGPFIACLIPELRQKDQAKRRGAFQTLMLIAGPEEIHSALRGALDSGDPAVRQWAAQELKRIASPP